MLMYTYMQTFICSYAHLYVHSYLYLYFFFIVCRSHCGDELHERHLLLPFQFRVVWRRLLVFIAARGCLI